MGDSAFHATMRRVSQPRNTAMAAAYLAGDSMPSIGLAWGITRERVRQILNRQGITFQAARMARVLGKPFDAEEFRRRSSEAWTVRSKKCGVNRIRESRPVRLACLEAARLAVAILGRTPTYYEVSACLGLDLRNGSSATAVVGHYWTGRKTTTSRTNAMRRWYRCAGLTPYRPGQSAASPPPLGPQWDGYVFPFDEKPHRAATSSCWRSSPPAPCSGADSSHS